jgi:uncharacterized membrane protein
VPAGAGRGRLPGVDATRGLALLGMMAVHVLPGFDADGSVSLGHLVAAGRSAATFAVLAGVGLALATGGVRPPVGREWAADAAGLAVRALVIGAVGLFLGLFDSGVAVILSYYALLFVVAVPLLGLRARALGVLAGAVMVGVPVVSHLVRPALAAPERANPTLGTLLDDPLSLIEVLAVTGYYPVLAWTAYVCAGLAVGRLPLRSSRVAAGLLGGGVVLAVAASAVSAALLGPLGGRERIAAVLPPGYDAARIDVALSSTQYGTTPTTTWWWLAVDAPHASTPLDLAHTTGVAVALLGAMLLLARFVRGPLVPLAAVGSMTLSLYTGHVLLLASDVLPDDRVTSYVLQVFAVLLLAPLWRRMVGRGPLEAAAAALAGVARRVVAGERGRGRSPADAMP